MRVVLLAPLVKGDDSFPVGKELDFTDEEAIALVVQGSAKPKNKKTYETALKKLETAKAEQEELEVKAYAILKQKELKESAEQLAKELVSTLELIEDEEFKSLLKLDSFGIVSETTTEETETEETETEETTKE